MQQVIKIALPGYNAITDNDPDHFSLYVNPDERIDYVLIKEKLRGSISVPASGSENIAHGLGYIPFCLVFYLTASGRYRKVHGWDDPTGTNPYFTVNSTNLVLENPGSSAITMKYYIFYDEIA